MSTVSPARAACPACGAEPRSALVCEGCGELLDPATEPTPFEVLGFEPAHTLDADAVRRRMLALSRALHPDFHANAGAAARQRAEDNTARLNAAFRVLSDEARRADWLVRWLGGPDENEERSMPPEFLQEVLEWNEAIEEGRASTPGSPARSALVDLQRQLAKQRAATLASLAHGLTPLPERGAPALRRARQDLNSLRYLERALAELRELADPAA